MDLGLAGKVIVVTGGASGIGEAITRACLAENAKVAILSRADHQADQLMAAMRAAGAACEFFAVELEDVAGCQSAIAAVEKHFGGIDGLVNNAALNDGIGLESGSVPGFVASLQKNLVHCYALAHFALPALKRSMGSIVNISSKVAVTGQGNTSGYAAAKGGALALTREWAVELLPYNIRVNAIIPAEVKTPAYDIWLKNFSDPEQRLQQIENRIPLAHRMTTPAEIAAATVFLLSPTQSGHTTGQQLHVDGGYVHLDRALT